MKVAAVVIPTYQEARSIGTVLEELIRDVMPRTSWDCHVLVVDANSPDGTADVVRSFMARCPSIHLIVEQQKSGLGAAYGKGFRHAMDVLGASAVIEFDGDAQHPPGVIPLLLDEIDAGADLVLGSRRRRGGSYPRGWSFQRRFFSTVGGFVSRLLLFFPTSAFWKVTDPTTGLKATRVDGRLRALDLGALRAGFSYKLQMLFQLVRAGARVSEVPLQFRLRTEGESKLGRQEPVEILWTCLLLRLRDPGTRRFLRFALVGFSGYVVNGLLLELFSRASALKALAGSFDFARSTLLAFLSQAAAWASLLSAEGSILNNFLWNNFWTFRTGQRPPARGFVGRLLWFNLASVGAILIQAVFVGFAAHFLGESTLVRQASLVVAIVALVLPFNWLVYSRLIWKKTTEA